MRLSAGPSLARKAEKPLRSNEPSARLVPEASEALAGTVTLREEDSYAGSSGSLLAMDRFVGVHVGCRQRHGCGSESFRAHQASASSNLVDCFSGSRHKHVKDRQCAIDRPIAQLGLHVLSDEKTEVEQRSRRDLKVSQLPIDDQRAEAS